MHKTMISFPLVCVCVCLSVLCQELVNEEVCPENESAAADFNLLFCAIGKLSFISSTVRSCNPSGDTSPGAHDSNTPMRICMCVCVCVWINGNREGRG